MANHWPTANKTDDKDTIRLMKDGDICEVVLLEDAPEVYYTHYVNGKTTKCSNLPDCEFCKNGVKQDAKGSIKVRDMADAKDKKLNGTAALFITLKETIDLCGGHEGNSFKIKATKDGKDRRYHIANRPVKAAIMGRPDPEEPPAPEEVFQ